MTAPDDVLRQLNADFASTEVPSRLRQLCEATESPRLQRCIVFAARGHPWYFDYLCRLVDIDFRDVIMAAEYDRMNARLYDFNQPIGEARIDDPYASGEGAENRIGR